AVKESVRASLWETSISAFIADIRYALRMLRRSPAFSLVIVLVISLGTGAVTTIMSAANAFLFRPLPGASDANELVQVDRITRAGNEGTQASNVFYEYFRDNNHTFSSYAAWSKVNLTLSVRREGTASANDATFGVAAYGNIVSGNFFSTLGVRPELGRFFLPDEDRAVLAHPVVVVSHAFWKTHLSGDSSVIGKTIGVNGHPFTLIGVAPDAFHGVFTPIVASAWVPLAMQPWVRPNRSLDDGNATWLWTFGRMRQSTSRIAVKNDLVELTKSFMRDNKEPEWTQRYTDIRLVSLTGLPDDAQKAIAAFLGVLLAAAALVLIIACVNVAAMLSARAIARRHEMALRIALGAQRSRIIRQLLTESVVLFFFGALGGMIVAYLSTRAIEQMPLPASVPMTLEISPDLRVLTVALLASLFTGIVFGIAPALRAAREDVTSRLRDDAPGSGRRRGVVSSALIVGQLSLSLVLLVSAGLLFRAFDRGQRVDPGFDARGVVTAPFAPEAWGYDDAKARAFYDALRERVAAIPGVDAVSFVATLPLTDASSNVGFEALGGKTAANSNGKPERIVAQYVSADYGYFETVRIPLQQGRAIRRTDDERSAKVVVINETMARRAWPNESPLGHMLRLGNDELFTVIGVARDAKYKSLTETTTAFVYFSVAQKWRSDMNLLAHTNGDAQSLSRAIQHAVHELDTAVPRPAVITLARATSFTLLPQRVAAIVAGSLGIVGLLLATVGLYGMISYSAGRRTREIGIRMALGAQGRDVQRMVVREGMQLVTLGVVIGIVIAVGTSRMLSAYLYGVSPLDGVTFVGMSVVFASVALLASYLPARRASRANPLAALRSG
ncbi:MAG: ABC transporter permease, partial [Gemmatimonadaceae bacterium]